MPWVVEECQSMTYRVEYYPGKINLLGDAMSRTPVIRERPLAVAGMDILLAELLSSLDEKTRSTIKTWVWAEKETAMAERMVQQWRSATNPIVKGAPRSAAYDIDWDFAVVAATGERAPVVCADLFATCKKFACLVPTDLVNYVPLAKQDVVDEALVGMVRAAQKVVSVDVGLTWIVGGFGSPRRDVVFAVGVDVKHDLERVDVKRHAEDVRVSDLPVGDIKIDWVREQYEERESLVAAAVGEVVALSSGLLVEVRQGERARVIVPPMRRNALIRMAHEAQQHRSWKRF